MASTEVKYLAVSSSIIQCQRWKSLKVISIFDKSQIFTCDTTSWQPSWHPRASRPDWTSSSSYTRSSCATASFRPSSFRYASSEHGGGEQCEASYTQGKDFLLPPPPRPAPFKTNASTAFSPEEIMAIFVSSLASNTMEEYLLHGI